MSTVRPEKATQCRICGGREGSTHQVREMMFGTRKAYEYFLCEACGCLQLATLVAAEEQYPANYYSYQLHTGSTGARAVLRALRNRTVFRGGTIGRLVSRLLPYAEGADRWFSTTATGVESRILDVGCGAGQLTHDLVEAGYKNAEGIDPYIPEDVVPRLPRFVRKAWLSDVSGQYDVVMFHHVLEHVPDPEAALRDAARLLGPGGVCLVRVPVVPNEAWEKYRESWVQLDAPRHLFIHSTASLTLVAKRAGLQLDHLEYDSTEMQFTGSELYLRGGVFAELRDAFSLLATLRYRRKARQLNRQKRGDQAAFYFRKPPRAAARTKAIEERRLARS